MTTKKTKKPVKKTVKKKSTVPCTPAAATGGTFTGKDSTVAAKNPGRGQQEATPRVDTSNRLPPWGFPEHDIVHDKFSTPEQGAKADARFIDIILAVIFALIVGILIACNVSGIVAP